LPTPLVCRRPRWRNRPLRPWRRRWRTTWRRGGRGRAGGQTAGGRLGAAGLARAVEQATEDQSLVEWRVGHVAYTNNAATGGPVCGTGGAPSKDDSRLSYEQQLKVPNFIVQCTRTPTLDPQSPSNVAHTQQRGREEGKARKKQRKKEERRRGRRRRGSGPLERHSHDTKKEQCLHTPKLNKKYKRRREEQKQNKRKPYGRVATHPVKPAKQRD